MDKVGVGVIGCGRISGRLVGCQPVRSRPSSHRDHSQSRACPCTLAAGRAPPLPVPSSAARLVRSVVHTAQRIPLDRWPLYHPTEGPARGVCCEVQRAARPGPSFQDLLGQSIDSATAQWRSACYTRLLWSRLSAEPRRGRASDECVPIAGQRPNPAECEAHRERLLAQPLCA